MALYYTFSCPLPNGLHARPASRLAELAGEAGCEVRFTNQRNEAGTDAASVLGLIATATLHGDPCELELRGPREEAARAELARFIEEEWALWDAALAPAQPAGGKLPRVLSQAGARCLGGLPLSPGVAAGRLVVLRSGLPRGEFVSRGAAEELSRLAQALAAVEAAARADIQRAADPAGRELLRANLAMLTDAGLQRDIRSRIEDEALAAEQAVIKVVEASSARLAGSSHPYLRERYNDLLDLALQLCEALGAGPAEAEPLMTEPGIVAARNLAPRQLLGLDKSLLLGLVLADAGPSSHAAILCRALGLPALSGIAAAGLSAEGEVLLDGGRGLLYLGADAAVRRFYARQAGRESARRQRQAGRLEGETRSADGLRIEVSANVATLAQLPQLEAQGAEGIGLLRTELLLADYDHPPTEVEQYRLYREAAEALAPWPVIIRTLDVGGDKPLPWLPLPQEPNPFLGCRGLRIYRDHPAILTAQLRAILRASVHGRLRVMAPMVTNAAEAAWFREQVEAVKSALAREGVACDAALPVGAMIEVPSAALSVTALSEQLDFFSIGSNDLSQYSMAADRTNARVSGLADECEPGFLRLLKGAVDMAQAAGRWIGLCGEMAGRRELLPLLLGLGLSELSLDAARIPETRVAIAALAASDCRRLLERAITCRTAEEVRGLLRDAEPEPQLPLLDAVLIDLAADCRSKAEVLSEFAGMLYAAGRCDEPDALEEALWAREAAFSTALGGGIAVPHCKADAVIAPSLAVLRLATPVDWGAEDGAPVHTAIMLAFREAEGGVTHLKLFAKLARRLVHEEFRAALLAAESPVALTALLRNELGIE